MLAADPVMFDSDILAVDEANLFHAVVKRGDSASRVGRRSGTEKPDHWYRRLLRVCRERPDRCAA